MKNKIQQFGDPFHQRCVSIWPIVILFNTHIPRLKIKPKIEDWMQFKNPNFKTKKKKKKFMWDLGEYEMVGPNAI